MHIAEGPSSVRTDADRPVRYVWHRSAWQKDRLVERKVDRVNKRSNSRVQVEVQRKSYQSQGGKQ